MPAKDNKAAIEILIQTLSVNPELWETRKKTAEILFEGEQYAEAADILWNAPEIPSTDTDVAFVIKIISRAQPNRAIRMVYEIVKRNNNKPLKNMAVASALNDIGMYMQAARFYGAALASDPSLIDLSFERQALWLDDSHRLIEEWQESDQESKPPLDVPSQEITGGTIAPSEIPEDIGAIVQTNNFPAPAAPAAPAASAASVSNPLMPSASVQKRALTPTAMSPTSADVSTMSTPAPIRPSTSTIPKSPSSTVLTVPQPSTSTALPVPQSPSSAILPIPASVQSQAIPTQPLQVGAVKAAPVPAVVEEQAGAPCLTIGSATGKLLTPVRSNKPPARFK